MAKINPYLTFNGNCEEAFLFYKSIFKSEFKDFDRFQDAPQDSDTLLPNVLQKIMNVSMPIGGETILMGSDTHPMSGHVVMGQNMSLSINAESKEEASQLFSALADGGNITMPISEAFWGAYFGMLKDKFGIQWMVNFEEVKNS